MTLRADPNYALHNDAVQIQSVTHIKGAPEFHIAADFASNSNAETHQMQQHQGSTSLTHNYLEFSKAVRSCIRLEGILLALLLTFTHTYLEFGEAVAEA